VTVGLAAGMIAATASRADAASYIIGCFQHYQGGNMAGYPAQIDLWWPGYGWIPVATTTLGVSGCIQLPIPANLSGYYWKMSVNFRLGGGPTSPLYFGTTPYFAYPGPDAYWLGTGIVNCIGCAPQ